MKTSLFLFSLLVCVSGFAQARKFTRVFQASLTPGLSTNGFHPGGYRNFFSLNLTSGYSAANYLLELGLLSNLNVEETRGLQIAAIANLTGANAFENLQIKEIDKRVREGFEANLTGLQISGLVNKVLNNSRGGQVSGGVNISFGMLEGAQIAGLANIVGKYSFGLQLAGLYNVSRESMDGLQVATLFNYTDGGLYGGQIGFYNKCRFTEGINSYGNQDPIGFQIGCINQGASMNGFQIGLINLSKAMQGTQIGLINIYRHGKAPETRDGTAIGLVNIGSSGYFSAYANEVFYYNIEIATGTIKNRRMNNDITEKQIQNGLIYSRGSSKNPDQWAVGYGLKKMFFNRSVTPGLGHFRYVAFGIDWLHINHQSSKFTNELSLLTRPSVSFGSRFHPKNKVFFFFAALSYNVYKSESGKQVSSFFKHASTEKRSGIQQWPGFSLGVLIQ